MTYEKIFSEVKKNFKKAKIKNFTENFAFQFNIIGEGEGIFYTALKDGVLSIEPYDYNDRDVIFETDGKTLIALASGKTEPIDAIKAGKLSIDGNQELAKQFIFLINTPEKAADKKPLKTEAKPKAKTETKSAAKTETKSAAKTEIKPAAKAEVKPAAKTEAKPAAKAEAKPAAKTEAKPAAKTEAKPEAKTEAKPAAKTEAKPKAKAEAKPAARTAVKKAAKK